MDITVRALGIEQGLKPCNTTGNRYDACIIMNKEAYHAFNDLSLVGKDTDEAWIGRSLVSSLRP